MRFVILFHGTTCRSVVHASGCRCARRHPGVVSVTTLAESAAVARDQFIADEALRSRGLPLPTIAPCARRST